MRRKRLAAVGGGRPWCRHGGRALVRASAAARRARSSPIAGGGGRAGEAAAGRPPAAASSPDMKRKPPAASPELRRSQSGEPPSVGALLKRVFQLALGAADAPANVVLADADGELTVDGLDQALCVRLSLPPGDPALRTRPPQPAGPFAYLLGCWRGDGAAQRARTRPRAALQRAAEISVRYVVTLLRARHVRRGRRGAAARRRRRAGVAPARAALVGDGGGGGGAVVAAQQLPPGSARCSASSTRRRAGGRRAAALARSRRARVVPGAAQLRPRAAPDSLSQPCAHSRPRSRGRRARASA